MLIILVVTDPEETTDAVFTAFAKYGCVWGGWGYEVINEVTRGEITSTAGCGNCSQIVP